MGVGKFQAGQQLRIGKDEYIMLRKVTDSCWQLEQSSTRRIREYEQVDLSSMFADGTLMFCASEQIRAIGKLQTQLPRGESDVIKKRRMYVKVFLDECTHEAQVAAIRRVHAKFQSQFPPPSRTTVYRWARLYRGAGADARVLARRHHNKGNRADRFAADVIDICNRAINEVYMRRERGTIADTHEKAAVSNFPKADQAIRSAACRSPEYLKR